MTDQPTGPQCPAGPPTPTPPPYAYPPQAEQRKGLAVTALVLGIIAILGSWIPFVSIASVVIGVVGLVFGIIAIVKAMSGKAGGKVMAFVGAGLSLLAIIFGIVSTGVGVAAVDEAIDEYSSAVASPVPSDEPDTGSDTEPTAEATDDAAPEAGDGIGTMDNPAAIGDGTVWTITEGDDAWDITFDGVEVVSSWTGEGQVAVLTGTATPTSISDGDLSNWASFPFFGWIANGATIEDTYEMPDPDQFADYRSTLDLEATVGTEMSFYTSVGLPEGVVPELITVETLFGDQTLYVATGL